MAQAPAAAMSGSRAEADPSEASGADQAPREPRCPEARIALWNRKIPISTATRRAIGGPWRECFRGRQSRDAGFVRRDAYGGEAGRNMADVDLGRGRPEDRRPLSPHLQIYRPTLTMAMSIAHRITGAALYLGTLLLAWFLIAASTSAESFATISGFLDSIVGRVILFGFSWALYHHLLGGIRHIIWDTGRGLEPREREGLAQATLICGLVLTVLTWIIGLYVR
jgi:succinate dehydrogenase / fumarate reductase cytochrome b subunit